MAYQTKSITLSASWAITGSVHADDGIEDNTFGLFARAQASVALGLGGVDASASIDLKSIVEYNLGTSIPNWTADAGATGATSDSNRHKTGHSGTVALTGNATLSVPCLLCWDYEGQSPNQFAGGVVDAPPYRLLRFFLIGAGIATTSISFGPVSASGSVDVRGQQITPSLSAGCTVASSALVYPVNSRPQTGYLSGTASVSAYLTSCTFGLSDESASTSDTFTENHYDLNDAGELVVDVAVPVSASSSGGGASVNASCANGGQASGTSGGAASRSFDLSGVIRAMLGDYPGSLTLSCSRYAGDDAPTFTAGSTFSRSYTQRSYTNISSSQAHTDNSQPAQALTKSKNEFQDVGIGIVRASLTANGDEPLASRILLRGKQADGLSIAQAATFSFDDFASGWTATGGASVSHDADGLHIQTGSGSGGASGTYSPARSMASYRYLRVPLKSVGAANVPVVVSLNGKSWSLQTGGDSEQVSRDIDLCAPNTGGLSAGQTDSWDGHWPLPTTASATSGPFNVSGVTLSGIPANRQIVVGSLLLARHDAPTVDCVPTLFASLYHPSNGTSDPYIDPEWPLEMGASRQVAEVTSQDSVRRFLLVDTDGRQGPEERDFWYTRNSSDQMTSYSFNMDTVQGLCDQINATDAGVVRWPGWSATPAVPFPTTPFVPSFTNEPPPETPYYFNAQQLLATEVRGGGILFSHDGAAYGFDLPTGSLSAQPLFDGVRMCGLEGDVFGFAGGVAGPKPNGAGVDALALRAGTILRGGAHGLVFDSDKQPKADQTVLLKQNSATVASGTSRSDGWYHADNAPAAKTPLVALVQAGSKTASLSALWTRHRHRVVFVVAGQAFYGPLAIDSPRQYLHVANGKKITTFHIANGAFLPAWESAAHPVLEWTRLGYDERFGAALFALGRIGDNQFTLYRSGDQGRSLLEILTVTAKTIATVTDSERKWIVCLYSDASDAVFSKASKDGGASWGAAQSTGLTGGVLDLCHDGRAGLLLLTLRGADDTVSVLKTRDAEGLNWIGIL